METPAAVRNCQCDSCTRGRRLIGAGVDDSDEFMVGVLLLKQAIRIAEQNAQIAEQNARIAELEGSPPPTPPLLPPPPPVPPQARRGPH